MKKRIVIIGAGASGLAAAIEAARTGADVIVLEHTGEIGKKLLMTGNGRCNYTNTDMSPAHFHSHSDRKGTFVQTVLSAFGWEDTVHFFRELGINPRIRHYEYDRQAFPTVPSHLCSTVQSGDRPFWEIMQNIFRHQ